MVLLRCTDDLVGYAIETPTAEEVARWEAEEEARRWMACRDMTDSEWGA
jgi:hypothetical protein